MAFIGSVGGNNLGENVRGIMVAVMTNECALNYSFKGKTKKAFSALTISKLIPSNYFKRFNELPIKI